MNRLSKLLLSIIALLLFFIIRTNIHKEDSHL